MSDLMGNPEDRLSHNAAHRSVWVPQYWEAPYTSSRVYNEYILVLLQDLLFLHCLIINLAQNECNNVDRL